MNIGVSLTCITLIVSVRYLDAESALGAPRSLTLTSLCYFDTYIKSTQSKLRRFEETDGGLF